MTRQLEQSYQDHQELWVFEVTWSHSSLITAASLVGHIKFSSKEFFAGLLTVIFNG